MSIGQMIKICRKEKNLTQSELASQIGVSVQAISKWETNSGMPDISQIVPLARVLEVSADKLLGLSGNSDGMEYTKIKEQVGCHGFILGSIEAVRIYDLVQPFFKEHPTHPESALLCLKSLAEMITSDNICKDRQQILIECERYGNCIFRYESDADTICQTYYIMARLYNMLDEKAKADSMLEKLPFVFGDRNYWEAETAWADKNSTLALTKCKESFALKARYISRCIRMAAMINFETDTKDGLKRRIELDKYMLRIINAFLSGGDYLPSRQIYQKTSLLSDMVGLYVMHGDPEKALKCLEELVQTQSEYFAFLDNPSGKHCLMFIEDDSNETCNATNEQIKYYVTHGINSLKDVPDMKNNNRFNNIVSGCANL